MEDIGVCKEGMDIMLPKMRYYVFMVRGLDPRAANILKQEMLAAGGEAAISYHTICDLTIPTDCLLSGTERQFELAAAKMAAQPFGLKSLSAELECAIRNLGQCGSRKVGPLELGKRTLVMGILNVTPDSFSGDGITDSQSALARGLEMASQGADIIDVGGESTRPGAEGPTTEEELARVIPVIKALAEKCDILISVDSRNPAVVEKALESGASIVNLVGGIRTPEMADLIAKFDVPVILMHMQGEPDTMQQNPRYGDVVDEIISDFRRQISDAVAAGINPEKIILDPGIGFGKTPVHNLEILNRLGEMRILGFPIMVGLSRKSFIGKILDADERNRLEGSIAGAVLASEKGTDMVRVHDVAETVRAIRVADAIIGRDTLK